MPTPVKRAFRIFRYLFQHEPWVFEVIFGFCTAVFFWLLWLDWRDGPMFGSIRILSETRSEAFWQWLGLGGGALQCVAAIYNKPGRNLLKWVRWAVAGMLTWLWAAMAWSGWIASPYSPVPILYAGMAAANIYVAFHVLWEDEFRRLRRVGG
jgi:hypothetical protein